MTDKTRQSIEQIEAWIKRGLMAVCTFFFIMLVNDVKDIKEAQLQMLIRESSYIEQIKETQTDIKELKDAVKLNTEHRIKTQRD